MRLQSLWPRWFHGVCHVGGIGGMSEDVVDFRRGPAYMMVKPTGHDWDGSPEREAALKVGCQWCGATPGQPCRRVKDGEPLRAFPAHPRRMTAAEAGNA